MLGGPGDDVIFAGLGADVAVGGKGDDMVAGTADQDAVLSDGVDKLVGGPDDDRIRAYDGEADRSRADEATTISPASISST